MGAAGGTPTSKTGRGVGSTDASKRGTRRGAPDMGIEDLVPRTSDGVDAKEGVTANGGIFPDPELLPRGGASLWPRTN